MNNGNVNQSWFTSREDKAMLRWQGHAWRQGMWSREETDLLQHNIEQYCAQRGLSDPGSVIFKMSKEERSGFYRVIARGLNRPLFSIYRRVIRWVEDVSKLITVWKTECIMYNVLNLWWAVMYLLELVMLGSRTDSKVFQGDPLHQMMLHLQTTCTFLCLRSTG